MLKNIYIFFYSFISFLGKIREDETDIEQNGK